MSRCGLVLRDMEHGGAPEEPVFGAIFGYPTGSSYGSSGSVKGPSLNRGIRIDVDFAVGEHARLTSCWGHEFPNVKTNSEQMS